MKVRKEVTVDGVTMVFTAKDYTILDKAIGHFIAKEYVSYVKKPTPGVNDD